MTAGFKSLFAGVLGRFASNSSSPPPVTTILEPDGFSTSVTNVWENVPNSLGRSDEIVQTGYNAKGNNLQSNKSSGIGFHDNPG